MEPSSPYVLITKRRGPVPRASCCVYLISGEGDHTKIGMSNDPKKRLDSLRTANPTKMALEHAWRLESRAQAASLEDRLHKLFKWAKVRREWFAIEPRYVQAIGDALIAGEDERATALMEAIRVAVTEERAGNECASRRRQLNVRWKKDEREALADQMDEHYAKSRKANREALRLGLPPDEADLYFEKDLADLWKPPTSSPA